jgi:tRNA threonylcarbamoyladenosine biosynthesis protein TsaB
MVSMSADRIIAIETSSRRGSVALAEGPRLIAQAEFAAGLQHAVELLPNIDNLLRQAGWPKSSLRLVFVSIGPGSFTGLRVAVTAARHLALALDVRIVAVPSLAVIADNARQVADPPQHLAVLLDAKRGQAYAAQFERAGDGYEMVRPAAVVEVEKWLQDLVGQVGPVAAMGEGVAQHRAAIEKVGAGIFLDEWSLPRAESVHRLGWRLAELGRFTPSNELVPLYLRRPEAEEVWERRHGSDAS